MTRIGNNELNYCHKKRQILLLDAWPPKTFCKAIERSESLIHGFPKGWLTNPFAKTNNVGNAAIGRF